MKLKVWVPTEVFCDEEVTKIKAEAENGWFCILPRHIDFVTSLVPGILSFELPDKQTQLSGDRSRHFGQMRTRGFRVDPKRRARD